MSNIFRLLPQATQPWRITIHRRHEPVKSSSYQAFRACLRWEFGFSCALCLLHESDISEHGTEGRGLMWIEHWALRSQEPALINSYENCFYTCRFCNEARGSSPLIDKQQRRLLNPCLVPWRDHFRLDMDQMYIHGDSNDAVYTYETYDLNDPRKVRMRRKRRESLSEHLDVVTESKTLHDKLLQLARDTGDPTLVDDAEETWNHFNYAYKDLERFSPIPEDASSNCVCGQHHYLPEVLEEQILWLDISKFLFNWKEEGTKGIYPSNGEKEEE